MSTEESILVVNGINGSTGRSLVPPQSPERIAALAMGEKWDLEHLRELKETKEHMDSDPLGLGFGDSAKFLRESGWGVVFPHNVAERVKQALAPLLEHRRAEASTDHEDCFKELFYLPGESKPEFLSRYEVGPGPVDPRQLPYYLLLVGSPEEIPYFFQYQLDIQYAVGRIHFENIEGYADYARSVVTAELGAPRRAPRMALFGVANPDDRATERSLSNLVRPLADRLSEAWGKGGKLLPADSEPWVFDTLAREHATKANLGRLMGGESTPALLFTASHGMGFEIDDPRLLPHQGALLCQEWPGPRRWRQAIPEAHYFAAQDVGDEADLLGLITFHFACYGAGTPRFDDYAHRESSRRQIAPESFVSRLPQRLLAHPRGGALATVGHIERAWSYSFDWKDAPQQISVFTSTLGKLFDGYPIGAAMEYFNLRYAELSSDLSSAIRRANYGWEPDFMSLSGMWTANNDARSYVVLGDPAVRLSVC